MLRSIIIVGVLLAAASAHPGRTPAATIGNTPVANALHLSANPNQVSWWEYKDQDCSNDLKVNCTGQTVDQCKALCIATEGCSAFNSHGWIKGPGCLQKKNACPGCQVILYVIEDTPQPPPNPSWIAAWPPVVPHPTKFSNGTKTTVVSSQLALSVANATSPDVLAAFARFKSNTFARRLSKAAQLADAANSDLTTLVVVVEDAEAPLQLETNEAYTLEMMTDNVNHGEIVLAARTQVGVMRGLETLSQLIRFDVATESYFIIGTPWVIEDTPRFKHRELLVDSSRHFQTVRTLKKTLDAMAFTKINVMHWHLVDHQSFPFRAPSVPLLADKGAYSPYERYTVGDVEDVVEYARQRGIRVVVEIDNPGHAVSWCAGYPEICPSLTCQQPLNPITNRTFEVIEDLFRDLTGGARGKGPFFDNFMHLGGDEVDTSCWDSTPEIAAWMKAKNFTATDTFFYFVGRSQEIARSMGRDVVGWEEIWNGFGTKLPKETIIQIWLSAATTKKVVEAGYRALYSPDPVWYLDSLNTLWEDNYSVEPCSNIADDVCEKYLLGGGGEMWGETVDGSDIQATVWPRLAAIAERLWSPRHITDLDAAEYRLHNFRCFLIERGVAAAPLSNLVARGSPKEPASCYAQ